MNIPASFKDKPLTKKNSVYYFLKQSQTQTFSKQRDFIDRLKDKAKSSLGPIYTICIYLFSPVMPRIHWSSRQLYLNFLINKYCSSRKSSNLNVGSGVKNKKNNFINLDIFGYPGVDVVADATNLPFHNNLFDSYISIAVLEHITNPEKMIAEASRVLKKDGYIITGVPFIQGFHASPHDYTRWTTAGLESIHKRYGFKTIEILPLAGPASSFTWIVSEFFSLFFSFGSKKMYYLFYFLFNLFFIPLKIVDLFLISYPESHRISCFFVYIGKK